MAETVDVTPESSAITLEVNLAAAGSPGAAGPGLPIGGTEFALPEKGAGGNFDVRWTNTPKVSALTLRPELPTASPLALGQMSWDTAYKSAKAHIGSDGIEAVMFIDKLVGPVYNSTLVQINKGDLVGFAGVHAGTNFYSGTEFLSDGSASSEYLLGVAAETIAVGASGLLKSEGVITGIDTTGTPVGEVWATGQVLYAHPTLAGKLTNVKPAPPAYVNALAVVLTVDTALGGTGGIGVRVTPRVDLNYGVFFDTSTQTVATVNTPKAVTYSATQISSKVHLGAQPSQIVCDLAGLYNFTFSVQVDKAVAGTSYLYLWGRKNGVDLPNSASRAAVISNNSPVVVALNLPVAMGSGDTFELMWAADNTDVHLDYSAPLAWIPAIPSVIMTVTQLAG